MIPKNIEELNQTRHECRGMVAKRATLSAGGAMLPVPGFDIAVDVGLLLELLPAINRRFGLAPEQIEGLDPRLKIMIYQIIIDIGGKVVGQTITKQLILQLLKRVGIRVTAKQVAKYIPFIGPFFAGGLSFGAMTLVGNSHVRDCYRVSEHIINNQPPEV